jgi:hypothetical protein
MLARRPFYAIGQQRNPDHPLKQNSRVKQPERRRNEHRLFIMSCQDAFHPPTHRRYIVPFKYGMVRRWTHGTCVLLCLFRLRDTSVLFLLIHWSNGHGRERGNPKRPLCIEALLNDHHCWGLVLKCYESRTRQHKVLNVKVLRPSKHYFP